MQKSIYWLWGTCFLMLLASFVSCSETDTDADLYANWKDRNQHYIDSIASVARANQGQNPGQWKVIHTYKFQNTLTSESDNVNDYVYCRILENGDGVVPLFTDTVAVDYRGQLIPLIDGTVVTFDESFSGNLNKETAAPTKWSLSSVITGWSTALINMRVGDHWIVYIPYELGYGTSGNSSIKGYSTLIFEMYLQNVYPLKGK